MKQLCSNILAISLVAQVLVLVAPLRAWAITRVNGTFNMEGTHASGPGGSSDLLEGGVSLDIQPQTKKNLRSRFSVPLRFVIVGEEKNVEAAPVGNFAVDMSGDMFNINLQYGRFATVSSTAEFVDTTVTRAALSLMPPDLPRLFTSYSRNESTVKGFTTTTNNYSMLSDYRHKWLNLRGGYSFSERIAGNATPTTSSSLLFGLGGNYAILPRTNLTLDYDFNRFVSETSAGTDTATLTHAFRLAADSRPVDWLGITGTLTRNAIDADSGDTTNQFMELTASLFPLRSLRFSATLGNRSFNDFAQSRSVTFSTVEAAFNGRLMEKVLVGLTASRTIEKDPMQGDNIRDNLGFNATMDLTPKISARMNLNINRNENRSFISSKVYDASGTLADRDALAADPSLNLPVGYVFLDTVNNDLYTLQVPDNKSTPVPDAVWSTPVHFETVTEQFSISKNFMLNMVPTDKTGIVLSYSSSASSERLDLAEPGNQSVNGSITYTPNRRTSYSLSGTLTMPDYASASYSGTATMSYRFWRNHQMNLSYARQYFSGRDSDSLSGTLGLALRKRMSMELIFSSSQLFRDDQTYFTRVRFTKSF